MSVEKAPGQKFISLINSILNGLDQLYAGGGFKDSGLGAFNWVEHERQLSNTNKDAMKASYLLDVIQDNFAKQSTQDQIALEKLADRLSRVQGEVLSNVPGLQQKVNELVRRLQADREHKVLENTNREVQRSRAQELADSYSTLSDEERAKAGDEKSTAGKIIKDFNEQADKQGFDKVDPGNAKPEERNGNTNAQSAFLSQPISSYETRIVPR